MSDWEHRCILCAARGRTTKLESGHCCPACAGWLSTQIADIARLAADAAAWLDPMLTHGSGGGGRSVPGSRPPLTVDALQPELTLTGPPPSPTVLEVLESWERMVRDARGLAPYGPVSAHRTKTMGGMYAGTSATLVGCVRFLGSQVPWMTTEAEFPLDDLADEVRSCVRVLRRFDQAAEDMGTMVKCPTLNDDGECGYRLYYRDWDEHVTCRRCGVTRDASTLVLLALSDPQSDVWADAEAIGRQFGVREGTLRKWARRGIIPRTNHGLYSVTAVATVLRGETA